MNKVYFSQHLHFLRKQRKVLSNEVQLPIILIDGDMIVDFMIDKHFGIEYEELPIYINALDNVLS